MATTTENPQLKAALGRLLARARERGYQVTPTSLDRSTAEQERLYANRANNRYPVAKPGTSAHEKRRAADLSVTRLKDGARVSPGEIAPLAAEVGLRWHGPKDEVHFELSDEGPAVPRFDPTDDERAALQSMRPQVAPVARLEPTEDEQEALRTIRETPAVATPPAATSNEGETVSPSFPGGELQPVAAKKEALVQVAEASPELTPEEIRGIAAKLAPTIKPAAPEPKAKAPAPVPTVKVPAVQSVKPIARGQVGKLPSSQRKPAAEIGRIPTPQEARVLLRNLPVLFDPNGNNVDRSKLEVLHVFDADTLDVLLNGRPLRIRLHAVDAPEKEQAFGPAARQYTANKTLNKRVQVEPVDSDLYGRTVGRVTTETGANLNRDLTGEGLAWWYKRYAPREHEIAAVEALAKSQKRGLWVQPNPTPPWEFRRKGTGARTGSEPPTGVLAPGTIDPRTLTVRKTPGRWDQVGHFAKSLVAGRTVSVSDASAAAVNRLQELGEIPTPKFSQDRNVRQRQEARLGELRGHVEAFDRLLDQAAVTATARLPYQPPQDRSLGPPEGPNDPRYLARDKALAEYRKGYRDQVEAAYGQQRDRWGWPELGPFLKARGVTLSGWDKAALDGAIRAKRAEWKFRPALNAAIGNDIMAGALELMGGEVTGVLAAHLAGPPLKAAATWAKGTGKGAVAAVKTATEGGWARFPREVRHVLQTTPNYLRSLGTGGEELARDMERLGSVLLQKTAKTGAKGDDLVQLQRHEAVRLWGSDLTRAERALERIATERTPVEAERVRRYLRWTIMRDPAYTPKVPGQKVAQGLSSYQTVSKLGGRPLLALRNATQRFTNSTLDYGATPAVRAQLELALKPWRQASRDLYQEAHKAGVFVGETATQEGKLTDKASRLLLDWFDRAEQGNRFVAARVRQLGMEQDLRLLHTLKTETPEVRRLKALLSLGARTEDAAVRRLGRSGIEASRVRSLVASGGRFTEQEIVGAMQRAARDEQFAMDLLSSPLWWESAPWLRAMTKFKPYAVKQWKLVQNVALEEVRKGNYAPAARYVTATILAGELYNTLRDAAFGGKRSVSTYVKGQQQVEEDPQVREIAKRLLRNFKDGGGLGIATDLMFNPGEDSEWEQIADRLLKPGVEWPDVEEAAGKVVAKAKGEVPGLVLGPTAGTVKNVQKALKPTDAEKRAVELIKAEIPAVREAGMAVRKHGPKPEDDSRWSEMQEQAEEAERQRKRR